MNRQGARRRRSEAGLAGCFETTLRVAFVGANYLMMAAGLALVGYSIYIFTGVRYTPSGAPSGHDSTPELNQVPQQEAENVDHQIGADADSAWEDVKPYWFGFVIAAMGIFTFVTALFALCGAKCDKTCCLATHILMLLFGLLAECTFGAVFYFDKGWNWDLPADESGQSSEFRKFVQKHLRMSLYIALVVVILQICSLLLGWALWSWAAVREEDEDEDAAFLYRALVSRDPTNVHDRVLDESKRTDRWSLRMKEEYGLDTSKFSYNPEAPNRGCVDINQNEDVGNHHQKCRIM